MRESVETVPDLGDVSPVAVSPLPPPLLPLLPGERRAVPATGALVVGPVGPRGCALEAAPPAPRQAATSASSSKKTSPSGSHGLAAPASFHSCTLRTLAALRLASVPCPSAWPSDDAPLVPDQTASWLACVPPRPEKHMYARSCSTGDSAVLPGNRSGPQLTRTAASRSGALVAVPCGDLRAGADAKPPNRRAGKCRAATSGPAGARAPGRGAGPRVAGRASPSLAGLVVDEEDLLGASDVIGRPAVSLARSRPALGLRPARTSFRERCRRLSTWRPRAAAAAATTTAMRSIRAVRSN